MDLAKRQAQLEKLEEENDDLFEELDGEFLAYPEDLAFFLLQEYYSKES